MSCTTRDVLGFMLTFAIFTVTRVLRNLHSFKFIVCAQVVVL